MIRSITFLTLLTLLVPRAICAESPTPAQDADPCSRIVSIAPSVTEVLFDLRLGKNVVGVTRYDRYPSEVIAIAKIGGFLDPNYEAIMSLRPAVVIGLHESREALVHLGGLGLRTLEVDHRSVRGIIDSFKTIGASCDRKEEATAEMKRLESEVNEIRERIDGDRKIRTLVSLGREGGTDQIGNLFISGKDGFYSDILRLAGGENVYTGDTVGLPTISYEGIIGLNPEVVIEIVSKKIENEAERADLAKAWKAIKGVPAADRGAIYFLDADYASIPGPRFPLLLRDIAEILHPEAFK